ncbi:MAG: DUF1624 domain-containing protein [Oligoflexia bacterium]|nr:DUF1624 domain-containing protein [Oligoflexia bacterium]
MELTIKKRFPLLDLIRGIAVIFMIIFHSTFDLKMLKFISHSSLSESYWFYFPRLIVCMFLFCVGASLSITHKNKFKLAAFSKRLLLIGFWAIIISIATYILFPKYWIKFGMLHIVATSSLLSIPFIKRPFISLFVSIIILLLFFIIIPNKITFPPEEWAPNSFDYIPIYPWFSAVLLGIFWEHLGFFKIKISVHSRKLKFIQFLGRHSLLIYILHQPFLYGTLYAALYILTLIK